MHFLDPRAQSSEYTSQEGSCLHFFRALGQRAESALKRPPCEPQGSGAKRQRTLDVKVLDSQAAREIAGIP